jgi:general secretion pathway protein A
VYLSHYKLKKKPFDISPDPDFMWLGEKHQEGLATLKYGILQNKGFLMITGDVGTGKTALIRAIEKEVQAKIIVITIPDPSLSLMDFYNVMASELNIGRSFESKGAFLIEFKKLILKAASSQRRVLMIIDESHRLNSPLLEEIRLLSNIDLGGQVLINTFFVGQLEFKALVAKPENRAVRQRITVSYELLPLTLAETQQYIAHRLKVAGTTRAIFTPEAIRLVHNYSRGYPRLINIICDHALILGFSGGVEHIDQKILKECGEDLKIAIGAAPAEQKKQPSAAGQKVEKPVPIVPPPPVENPNRAAWRHAAIVAAFLAAGVLTWHFGGDRISNELYRFAKGNEQPRSAGEKPNRAVASTPERSGSPAAPGATATQPAQRDELPAKAVAPIPVPAEPARPAAAPAAAPAPSRADTPAAVKIETAEVAPPPPPSPTTEASKPSPAPPPQPAAVSPPVVAAGTSAAKEAFGLKEFTLYFTKNSTEIPIYAQDQLSNAASLLKTFPETQAVIEGHTDSSGDHAMNKAISEGRAAAVRDYFVDQGIGGNRLAIAGYGPDKPLESNSTFEGRSKNRRVVIRIVTATPK